MHGDFLAISHVEKSYNGVHALVDFDFSVRKGEVHCLVGENGSGKSTLIKILSGVVRPDRNPRLKIEINERQYLRLSPQDSMREGIQVIYQDLSLFPNLSVVENITVNQRIEKKSAVVSWKRMKATALAAMERIAMDLDPDASVEDLPIAKQQLVAICRAISTGARLIIMDEPTASLGKTDVDHLLSVIARLKEAGMSVLFVGHKLNEVLAIADRITVIRDGSRIRTFESRSETSESQLIALMTGRSVGTSRYSHAVSGSPLLSVRALSKKGQYHDVSFDLYRGDVLGIIGLVGAGRTELATTIFGLTVPDSGSILIDSQPVLIRSTQDAIRHGIGFVPENRLTHGLFVDKSIRDNIIVSIIRKMRKLGPLLNRHIMDDEATQWVDRLNVKTPSPFLPVKQLSGGNQQRVVLSKWLATRPRILILDEPTVGIDVGAKAEIHAYIRDLAAHDIGIIMISDEIQEVLQNANRILVMHAGRMIRDTDAASTNELEIMELLR